MRRYWKGLGVLLVAVCLLMPMLVSCGGSQDKPTSTTVVIGYLTDLTGAAADAMKPIGYALKDYCAYVNSEGLIPNVTLKVVDYDTKYDTSRFMAGYEWLKSQGAHIMFTGFPGCAESLKTRAEIDGIAIISCSTTEPMVENPGAVFGLSSLMKGQVPAMLKWINENDWEGTGPATIGMATWNVSPNPDIEAGLKKYCEDNPSQFTLVGTSFVPAGTVTWSAEVTKYKDCDYLWFGSGGAVAPSTFIAQYVAGGGKGKLLATDTLVSYVGAITDKVGWAGVDGMLNGINWGWWSLDSDQMRLATNLLKQSHSDVADEWIGKRAASGLMDSHITVELVRAAIDKAGTENLTSRKLYEALQTVSVTLPGFMPVDFSNGNREGLRYFQMWEWSAAEEDLILVSDWIETLE